MTDLHCPSTESEAGERIRACVAQGTRSGSGAGAGAAATLAIVGGNTRSGFGNRVETAAVLSSRGLTGITDYDPAEMVMTARAGTPMADIEAALSGSNQMLAFEPVDHRGVMGTTGDPTIGGVFLTNASGPRRLSAGASRDSLLGLRFVNGRGEAIRAGGRVMKNVTGLDLVKLLAGSHGTLGFVTEVTFRVLPRPETAMTILLTGLDDATAAQAMAAAMASSADVSGAAHVPAPLARHIPDIAGMSSGVTALRLEGLAASVSVRAASLTARLSAFAAVETLDSLASARLWQAVRDILPLHDRQDRPVWRVSVAPSAGHRLVSALRRETGADALYDWQGGLVWLRMEDGLEAERVRRCVASAGGGHATLIRASAAQRLGISAFEPQPGPIAALSARIREKLDPAGIFSPGKMAT